MSNDIKIRTVQFKRGLKAILEARLIPEDLGVPMVAEPIFETDTGKLKIGDGVTSYIDLPYIAGGESGSDSRFAISDPLSNQILLYDADLKVWVNKDLADKESIIYLAERGLTIKGYEDAVHGDMLVKDDTLGLTWVKPLSTSELNQATSQAQASMEQAGNYAVQAGNSAVAASTSEGNANRINQQTMQWVNDKFWWGTLEEYNAEIAENGVNPGTFYFVRP